MSLTPEQLLVVRSWVGSEPTDLALNERYTRLATLNGVVEETLRSKIALLLEQPSSVSLPSGLSIQTTQNITAMQQTLKSFLAVGSIDPDDAELAGTVPGVTKLTRPERR